MLSVKAHIIFIILCITSIYAGAKSQIIKVDQSEIDNEILLLNPGDTLLINAGVREYLTFRNFNGLPNKPFVVLNHNGRVIIETQKTVYYKQGINIKNCTHFKLKGNGLPNQYGFHIKNTLVGSGIDIRDFSSNIEIAFVKIENTHFAGIIAKTDPTCDTNTWRSRFVMDSMLFHNNYILNTSGEGLYIGSTAYRGVYLSCNNEQKMAYPHLINNLTIYNNIFENTGREAVQVFSSVDAQVYGNEIYNYGRGFEKNHSSGMLFGLGSSGQIYNNLIDSGYGHGIYINSTGNCIAFNNIISKAGMLNLATENILACGIYLDAKTIENTPYSFTVLHNTITSSKNNSIRILHNQTNEIEINIINNTLSNYGAGPWVYNKKDNEAIRANNISYLSVEGTLTFKTLYQAGFLDPLQNNFQLTANSKAIDAGVSYKYSYQTEIDRLGISRPIGDAPDAGAFEYPEISDSAKNNGAKHCDEIFYPGIKNINGSDLKIQPGDTVCFIKGDYTLLQIDSFIGTADSPVVFTNLYGPITFKNSYVGLRINNCNWTTFNAHKDYPWVFNNISGNGISNNSSKNLEFNNLSFSSIANSAIHLKNNNTQKAELFNIENCRFQNILGHHCINIENENLTLDSFILSLSSFIEIKGASINIKTQSTNIEINHNSFKSDQNILKFTDLNTLELSRNWLQGDNAITLGTLKEAYIFSNIIIENNNSTYLLSTRKVDSLTAQFNLYHNTIYTEKPKLLFNQAPNGINLNVKNNLIIEPKTNYFFSQFRIDEGDNLSAINPNSLFSDYPNSFELNPSCDAHNMAQQLDLHFLITDYFNKPFGRQPDFGAISLKGTGAGVKDVINKRIDTAVKKPLELIAYPNPSNDLIHLEVKNYEKTMGQIVIYGLNGIVVFNEIADFSKPYQPIWMLEKGVYTVIIISGNEMVQERLVITR